MEKRDCLICGKKLTPTHLKKHKLNTQKYREKFNIPFDIKLFPYLNKDNTLSNENREGEKRIPINEEYRRKYHLLFKKEYFDLFRFLFRKVIKGGQTFFVIGDIAPKYISKESWVNTKYGIRKKLTELEIISKPSEEERDAFKRIGFYDWRAYYLNCTKIDNSYKNNFVKYIEDSFYEYFFDEYVKLFRYNIKKFRKAKKVVELRALQVFKETELYNKLTPTSKLKINKVGKIKENFGEKLQELKQSNQFNVVNDFEFKLKQLLRDDVFLEEYIDIKRNDISFKDIFDIILLEESMDFFRGVDVPERNDKIFKITGIKNGFVEGKFIKNNKPKKTVKTEVTSVGKAITFLSLLTKNKLCIDFEGGDSFINKPQK